MGRRCAGCDWLGKTQNKGRWRGVRRGLCPKVDNLKGYTMMKKKKISDIRFANLILVFEVQGYEIIKNYHFFSKNRLLFEKLESVWQI